MTNDIFEGLNLPQLMELMEPIVLPDAVAWYPQTVGWQIAGLWLITVCLITTGAFIRRHRTNRYRRQALVELKQMSPEQPDLGDQIGTLVKRTAMAAYPRDQVASLTGEEWAGFLVASTSGKTTPTEASLLASAPYTKHGKPERLITAADQWIRAHRA